QAADLIKFNGLSEGKEVCRMKLPRTGLSPNPGTHRIAVDASARPVRIWMPYIYNQPNRLSCIEDAGERFVDKGDPRSKDLWAEGPRDLTVDRLRDEVYVKANGFHGKYYRIDDKSGKVKDTIDISRHQLYATQLISAVDGNLYTFNWSKGLYRFDRKGRDLNWEGQDRHVIP